MMMTTTTKKVNLMRRSRKANLKEQHPILVLPNLRKAKIRHQIRVQTKHPKL